MSIGIWQLLLLLVCATFYVAPTIVAFTRRHHQRFPIAIINIFLGWSFIAWVICLAWSASTVRQPNLPATS